MQEKRIAVRVSSRAYEWFQKRAEEQGLTLSQYARKMLYLEFPDVPFYEEVNQIIEEANQRAQQAEEYLPFYQSAVQRLREGQREIQDRIKQTREDLLPRLQQAEHEITACLEHIETNLRQMHWTVEFVKDVQKRLKP